MKKRSRSRILTALFIAFAVKASAAPTGVTVNGVALDDAASSYGTGWAYVSGTLTLSGAGAFTLSGTNTAGKVRVVVPADVTNAVTLSDLTLQTTGGGQCVFELEQNADVSLFLAGANTLASGQNRAGLEVPAGASVSITNAPSNGTARVWCVTVTNLTPNAAIVVTALDPYGVHDLVADENGKLYLWLPDGDYTFTAGSTGYTATVNGAATTAVANGLVAPLFATDGTALVFDGTTLAIKIINAKSGMWYVLYGVNTLGGTWELLRSICATTDGDLVFTDIDATTSRRFFKVKASITQPLP